MKQIIKSENSLLFGVISVIVFMTAGTSWLTDLSNQLLTLVLFIWLFAIMLWSSFRVVHHADMLAIRLGEPLGTLILTLAVISIEVSVISAVMLVGAKNPELGRDMMFSVIMIVLNGLIGLSLLMGGRRHHEQSYNFKGANAFLIVLMPLSLIGLVLPNFTKASEPGTFSYEQTWAVIGITILLYGAFLFAQTIRHKDFFVDSFSESLDVEHHQPKSLSYHGIFLMLYMLVIVLLSKKLAIIIDYTIAKLNAPAALGGFVVAFLVLAPEGLAAIKAATKNQLQRSVNICLGSALATIGLTIPAVLLIGLQTGKKVILGLDTVGEFMLILTLLVTIVNFSTRKSNVLQGLVHLVLFLLYIILIFD